MKKHLQIISLLGVMLFASTQSSSAERSEWSGSRNDKWNDAANWDTGNVPSQANDNAVINHGMIVLETNTSIDQIEFNGGVIEAQAILEILGDSDSTTDDLIWNTGSLTGTQKLILTSGNTGRMNSSVILDTTFTNEGTMNHAGYTTVNSGNTLSLYENKGTLNLNIKNNYGFSSSVKLQNDGILNVIGDSLTHYTQIYGNFVSPGSININSSILRLSGTNNNISGTVNINSNAELLLNTGTTNLTQANLAGAGKVTIKNGTHQFGNQINTRINQNGGFLQTDTNTSILGDSDSATYDFTISGGSIQGLGDLIIHSLARGNFDGVIYIDNQFTNEGVVDFSGNTYLYSRNPTTAKFLNRGTLNIATISNYGFSNQLPFENEGTVNINNLSDTNITNINSTLKNSGTINLNNGILRLTQTGNVSTGSFNLATDSTLHLNGGSNDFSQATINGNGRIFLTSGSHKFNTIITSPLEQTGGTATFDADTRVMGNSNATVNFAWKGGTVNGTGNLIIDPSANFLLNSGSVYLDTSLINEGTANHTGNAYLYSRNPGSVKYTNKGTLNLAVNNTYGFSNQVPFDNQGTVNIDNISNTSTTSINSQFQNSGVINLNNGTLRLTQTGNVSTGSFNLATDSTLYLNGGSNDFSQATINGNGRIFLTSGTHKFNSSITSPLEQTGGTATFDADTQILGNSNATVNFAWKGGTVNGTGNLTIDPSANFLLSNGFVYLDTSLINEGTANHTGNAYLYSRNPGSVKYTNKGTLNLAVNNTYGFSNQVPFDNQGTVNIDNISNTSITSINSQFQNSGVINLNNGILRLTQTGNVSTGSFNLATDSTLHLNGGSNDFSQATINGNGRIFLTSGSHKFNSSITSPLEQTGGTATFDADTRIVGDSNSNQINFDWKGGTVTGAGKVTIDSSAQFNVGNTVYLDTTLINEGTANHTGNSNLYSRNPSTVRYLNKGTLNLAVNNYYGFSTQVPFVNEGIVNIDNATNSSVTDIESAFTNSGIINLNNGVLRLTQSGNSSSGTFNLAQDSTLHLSSGSNDFSSATFNGSGKILLSNGNHEFSKTIATLFEQTNGASEFNFDTIISGDGDPNTPDFVVRGGSINGLGTVTINTNAQAEFQNNVYLNTHFVNQGHAKHSGNSYFLSQTGSNGIYQNDGTLDLAVNNTYGFSQSTRFVNNGIVNIDNATQSQITDFDGTVTQDGVLNLKSGKVRFTSVGNAARGQFNLSPNTVMLLSGGTFDLSDASFLGDGMLEISSGTFQFSNEIATSLNIIGGTIELINDTTVIGMNSNTQPNFSLSGATINGPGTLILDSNTIGELNSYTYLNTTLDNQGYFTHRGNSSFYTQASNALFLNNGVFILDAAQGSGFRTSVSLENNGLISKTNAESYQFLSTVDNAGTIRINEGEIVFNGNYNQNAGELNLRGGSVKFNNPTTVNAGTLSGSGTIEGQLSLDAVLFKPGNNSYNDTRGIETLVDITTSTFSEHLNIVGDLSFSSKSIIEFDFFGSDLSLFDYVYVSGILNLGGTLSLWGDTTLWSALSVGDSITLFNASNISGSFKDLVDGDKLYVYNPSTELPVGSFNLAINSTSLELTHFEPIPEPSTYFMFGLGSIVIGFWFYRRRKQSLKS